MFGSRLIGVVAVASWVSSVAEAQCERFDVLLGPSSAAASQLADALGLLYFRASRPATGAEVFVSDGTQAGTRLVSDLFPGPTGSLPGEFTAFGGHVYFSAFTPQVGRELFRTNGTAAGTALVADLFAGAGSSSPRNLTPCAGKLFFTASDGVHGEELWCTDGTVAGTRLVRDIRVGPGGSIPNAASLTCLGKTLLFVASDGVSGSELWRSDGTAAGTVLVQDIRPGSFGSSPSDLTVYGDRVVFAANDGVAGTEPWVTDGSSGGTNLVIDLHPSASSFPRGFVDCRGLLYFAAVVPGLGIELWRTNGTAAGTNLLLDINPSVSSSSPENLVCIEGKTLFFTAVSPGAGRELWMTDGDPANTNLVFDLASGPAGTVFGESVAVGDTLYFVADTGVAGSVGRELYSTRGIPGTTGLVCDVRVGPGASFPASLAVGCGQLFFLADDGSQQFGRELYAVLEPGPSAQTYGSSCDGSRLRVNEAPRLGQSITFEGACAPADHIGLLYVALSKPAFLPVLPGGCTAYADPLSSVQLAAVAPPTFGVPLFIPAEPSLSGLPLVAQVLFVNLTTVFPLRTTNGVLLVPGT